MCKHTAVGYVGRLNRKLTVCIFLTRYFKAKRRTLRQVNGLSRDGQEKFRVRSPERPGRLTNNTRSLRTWSDCFPLTKLLFGAQKLKGFTLHWVDKANAPELKALDAEHMPPGEWLTRRADESQRYTRDRRKRRRGRKTTIKKKHEEQKDQDEKTKERESMKKKNKEEQEQREGRKRRIRIQFNSIQIR